MTDPVRALQQAELTPDEVERILRACGADALLVGGQALATWAVHYSIEPMGELSRAVTMDVDFIGTSDIAHALQRSLGPPWKLRKGTLDDVGGQVAKVYARIGDGIKQVDFFSGIVGLDTAAVRKRAAEITLSDGVAINLLHPLDVLESRLRNLDSIPAGRNAIGVAQARLAVSVVRAFMEDFMHGGNDPRKVRQAVKRVEKIALDARLIHVALSHGIDVLAAVPVARIAYPRFHQLQWPRVLARYERKREKFVALQSRRVP
ncbi:MAG: hypothetical protein IPF50_08955 [Proteobacteria bacterium]|nr:hypothetical protein [Pseudomonadota bacterium]